MFLTIPAVLAHDLWPGNLQMPLDMAATMYGEKDNVSSLWLSSWPWTQKDRKISNSLSFPVKLCFVICNGLWWNVAGVKDQNVSYGKVATDYVQTKQKSLYVRLVDVLWVLLKLILYIFMAIEKNALAYLLHKHISTSSTPLDRRLHHPHLCFKKLMLMRSNFRVPELSILGSSESYLYRLRKTH